jgi:OTU domain-containing protein 6
MFYSDLLLILVFTVYRAIADQVQLVHSKGQLVQTSVDMATITFSDIRKLAADQMRTHVDMYAPFLALPGSCPEYDAYCDNVENVSSAVWGGQTELSAIAACLQVPIWVYEVGRPVLKMENGNSDTDAVLKVSYHRHFYALGEHYNSVKPVPQEVC